MPTAIDVFAKVRGHERSEQLQAARDADLLPYFRLLESPAAPVVEMEGAERVMLGSNNYLGLTADARVMQGARDALEQYGTGLTGSRLLNGTIPLHLELERELAEWMGTEEAIVFTTGHQANVGTLGTLLAPGDTVIADSGDHASILDGCLLSRAKLRVFRHNRLEKLEKALQRATDDGGGILVVVDGVFSMEGDVAPLPEIVELCEAYGARLMVDEAHGAGVLGARGAGASELFGVEDRVDLRMGTFSKSLASCGGFIAGSHEVIDYLRIQSRAFLFTAAAVPAAVGAALAALRVVRSEDGPPLFARELENARYLEDGLHGLGYRVIRSPQTTPIIPVLVEDDWKAVLLWRALYDAGVFVNVALHPAVPPGGALLRTSVMATHDRATLDRALSAFGEVKQTFEAEHGPLPLPRPEASLTASLAVKPRIGRLGVWRRHQPGPGIVPELEALGYDALWLGSSPSLAQARPYLEASEEITIATGILNIWQHEPADVAAQHAELTRDFPGSFLLGIGVGHPEATSDYTRPLSAMRAFFDGLDGVPRDERIAAALGPKMLDLAAERSLGTHPYFTTPEHTRFARERVGPDAIVAPEVAVVVEPDPEQARKDARAYAATYLGLGNYTSNLLRFGFTEADIADGGSDRLIDAVIPHGSAEAIAEAVQAHYDAGADHVCVQPLGHGPAPIEDYRALAAALL